MTYVSPFDAKDIIAGQGTSALELIQEVGELDYLLTGIGGGGLISGCCLVCEKDSPNCKVVAVEPDAAHDAEISLKTGKIVSIPSQDTIADGANTPKIGHLTLKIMQKHLN